jgi:(p)ppGpp synthase/HD superfamily hydrolase
VAHPYAVFCILVHFYPDGDKNLFLGGLLHDVLEDVNPAIYNEEKMRKDFGDRVTDIVKELSEDKDGTMRKAEKIETWRKRKEDYLAHLHSVSNEALYICAADKIHNTYEIIRSFEEHGNIIWNSFNSSKEQTIWYYGEVHKTLSERISYEPIVKELSRKVKKLTAL